MYPFYRRLFHPLLDIAALASGAALVLAFAPINQYYLVFLGLTSFLWTVVRASPIQAAWRGALFGAGFFGFGISWIYHSIYVYGQAPLLLAYLITGSLVALLAALTGLQLYCWRRLFPDNTLNTFCLAFPVLWVLFEILRSWLLTGFPWLFLGYTQTQSSLKAFAPFGGVYLISFLISVQAGLLVYTLLYWRKAVYTLPAVGLIWGVAALLNQIHWTQPQSTPLRVALIQGNVPQSLKWDPEQTRKTLALYKKLTQENWQNQIIVWPEGALPVLPEQAKEYLHQLDTLAKDHNTSLIVGMPLQEDGHYFNGVSGLGNALGTYSKRHLVPFGEYVPLENWLRGLIAFFDLPMSNFSPGPARQKPITLLGFSVATYLCYEIALPQEFLMPFPEAKLIVTLSDDAWFGNSLAPGQHLQIAQMRSIETGRYQLVTTDNGITAIINPQGNIVSALPQFTEAVLTGSVYAMTGVTPLMALKIPTWVFLYSILGILALTYRNPFIPRKN